MAYVYRFKNIEDDIIYIGYTGQTMDQRMNQHFTKGHLSQECYKSVARIDCMPLPTKSDAIIYEAYLINKYKPRYNKQSKKNDAVTLNIDIEESWKLYKVFKVDRVATKQGMPIWKIALINLGVAAILIAMIISLIMGIL